MFNVSQCYSVPQVLRENYHKGEKKKRPVILRSHFLQDIIGKI